MDKVPLSDPVAAAASHPSALRIDGLCKSFGGIAAINDLSADFPAGSLTAVIGPNGAGKTTLFNLITGVHRPNGGQVSLNGRDITGLSPRRVSRLGIGRAFQIAQIFPDLTVEDAIGATIAVRDGLHIGLPRSRSNSTIATEVEALLARFDLGEHAKQLTRTLPHGAKKRLDIALAVVSRPSVLLLDEPAAGLGHEGRDQMMGYIRRLADETGVTIVLVEHDMDLVFGLAERILVLNFGSVLALGSPAEIRANPRVVEAYLGEEVEQC